MKVRQQGVEGRNNFNWLFDRRGKPKQKRRKDIKQKKRNANMNEESDIHEKS